MLFVILQPLNIFLGAIQFKSSFKTGSKISMPGLFFQSIHEVLSGLSRYGVSKKFSPLYCFPEALNLSPRKCLATPFRRNVISEMSDLCLSAVLNSLFIDEARFQPTFSPSQLYIYEVESRLGLLSFCRYSINRLYNPPLGYLCI